jgi:adenosine deaminase
MSMLNLAGPALAALESLTPTQISFIRSLPKAELHAHLNGSIPLPVLQDLAASYTRSAPETLISNEAVQAGLEKLKAGVTLGEIGDFFGLFPAIYALTSTPEALVRATRGVLDAFFLPGEDGAGPECTYLELRTTPRETPQMTREVYLRSVLSTVQEYTRTLPPLPESLVHEASKRIVGVIASLDRKMSKEVMCEIVDIAAKLRKEGLDLVGVDLCGDPRAGDVAEWKDVFERVRKTGLGITLHIAEVCTPVSLVDSIKYRSDNV